MADQPTAAGLVVDPDLLTSRDLLRAKETLGLDNPWDRLTDPIHRFPFTLWCLRSRTDPDYSYDQALDEPFGVDVGASAEPDPPTPPPSTNGATPRRGGGKTSKPKPAGGGSESDAATTSASPATSTTS